MKMLHLALILLSLSDVLTQDSNWGVKYPQKQICAVRGFSVSIPCSYYYPTSNPIQVTEKLWCSMNSNTDLCKNPPYVYNSASNTKSDFEFTGDDKSDCTLRIHNVQFSYSGEYRFRCITNVEKWTGYPGVTLQVTDLKVSLIRLSGNGTLKPGDSLNLTCDVTCTQSSSQFVWFKNNELLPESGAVLHFPALTLRDSGNYTCTWKTNTTSGSKTISLQIEDVLTQDSNWGVKYADNQICAVRGFSVSIPCSYYYPIINPNIQVEQMLWCSMNSNTDQCHHPPYVYNSASNTKSDFEFTGDDKSNCTLLIHNVQFNYSGEYKFRFITDISVGRWTGDPGVTLQVTDLKVSLIRLSGNGTFKPGDSLNLTCDVNCTQSSSQFVWSKNNELLPESGAALHFPALTLRDSGNYTCTWKTNTTSGSKTISLPVEEHPDHWSIWMIFCVIAGLSLIISGAVIYSRRRVHTEQQKKDDSDLHAKVQEMESDSDIYANIQQKEDDFELYANA
ncbi:hypothetical protein C0J50_0534 [Silurus asotus]|uniref:Ig-like domain-containing protein n=1 Tax=Silurus asotus TaxID=30991 RepID=A0AAD5A8Y9_SILAS|nr:hypothetical protein C0J50_0534 [Silurus asotus]